MQNFDRSYLTACPLENDFSSFLDDIIGLNPDETLYNEILKRITLGENLDITKNVSDVGQINRESGLNQLLNVGISCADLVQDYRFSHLGRIILEQSKNPANNPNLGTLIKNLLLQEEELHQDQKRTQEVYSRFVSKDQFPQLYANNWVAESLDPHLPITSLLSMFGQSSGNQQTKINHKRNSESHFMADQAIISHLHRYSYR